jgi:hypothetical protein
MWIVVLKFVQISLVRIARDAHIRVKVKHRMFRIISFFSELTLLNCTDRYHTLRFRCTFQFRTNIDMLSFPIESIELHNMLTIYYLSSLLVDMPSNIDVLILCHRNEQSQEYVVRFSFMLCMHT